MSDENNNSDAFNVTGEDGHFQDLVDDLELSDIGCHDAPMATG